MDILIGPESQLTVSRKKKRKTIDSFDAINTSDEQFLLASFTFDKSSQSEDNEMVHVNKEENDDIQMFNIKFVQFKKTLLKSNPALWQRPSLEDRKDGKEKIL